MWGSISLYILDGPPYTVVLQNMSMYQYTDTNYRYVHMQILIIDVRKILSWVAPTFLNSSNIWAYIRITLMYLAVVQNTYVHVCILISGCHECRHASVLTLCSKEGSAAEALCFRCISGPGSLWLASTCTTSCIELAALRYACIIVCYVFYLQCNGH